MRALVAITCAAMLAGCATAYGDMGFTGGVQADQISATRWRIVARGNGYTDSTTIEDFALRKAAETTIQGGYEWFVVVGAQDKSGVGTIVNTTPQTTYGTATVYGNTASYSGTTYGGQTTVSSFVKPGQDVIIETGRGPRPQGAYDAAETLRYVLPRTER